MAEPSAPDVDRAQLAHAIGSLIWKDPERILDAVSRLRRPGAVIECRIRGGSMEQAIPRGSMLRVSLERAAPYRVGDIVAFIQDSGICVHRVAYLGRGKAAANYLITQGDACWYPDPPVELAHILGQVTEIGNRGRWTPVADRQTRDRAQSPVGTGLLGTVARLLEMNVRLAQGAARILRIRKERPSTLEA